MSQNRVPFEVSPDPPRDDDGRYRRTGTLWTAIAHIITAVIGAGVLSQAWAIAQLGWIPGITMMFMFSFITFYSSVLLAFCYRTGDPISGERNSTYKDAVRSILGRAKAKLCGLVQYLHHFGVAIGYTIAASKSMMAISESICFQEKVNRSIFCKSSYIFTIIFGVTEVILSQFRNFDKLWWLSVVAIVMSFTYSTVGSALGIAKVTENGNFKGSLIGTSIGRCFQALGVIAFAYSYSTMLIEIQDTVRSPPPEARTMKKAMSIGLIVITLFYMLCGCMGYAAFGDSAPGHLLASFGFFNPYWLVNIANLAIVIHLVCAYQMFAQPLFASMEKYTVRKFAGSRLITQEIKIPIPGFENCTLYGFQLICRTIFVVVTTMFSMLLPFFDEVIGLVGALGFWPLMVYFPVEMYITQMEIPRWSSNWIYLQILSIACFIISIAAAAGSIAEVVVHLKSYKPLGPSY
ncbi:hypothetical protein BT93_D0435 [Corymbia citriodora subsp. variegata]|nr:hypothetical protein BT93_D0435 [Corymbia citriodora subsp. variegata]